MIGEAFAGFVLTAAAISPGASFVRIQERFEPLGQRSPLREAAELFFVGALMTSLSLMAILSLNDLFTVVDANTFQADSFEYLLDHPARLLGLVVAVLLLSNLGAVGLAYSLFHGDEPSIEAGSALSRVLARHKSEVALCTAELRDGRAVYGQCWGSSPEEGAEGRDLALANPLKWRRPLEEDPRGTWEDVDDYAVVIPGSELAVVSVKFAEVPKQD